MLDPQIILGSQPVTPQNPLQTIGALAALKNQQIDQQAGQQALQQKRYAFEGMQALNQAIAKNTQPTPEGGVTVNHEGVMKDLTAGGRADVANSYLTNYTDQREKIAKADDQELKNQIERHGQFASIINGVQAAPPEQRQAAYESAIQQAKKNKLLSPEELAKVPPQVPDDATLNSLKIGSLDVKSAAQSQKDTVEAKRAAQQTQQEAELQPGKVAKQQGDLAADLTKRVGQQLSTPRSVDAYQKLWNGLSDDERAAAEKQGFTPGDQVKNARDVMNATANAGKLATTVKERADIEHQGVEEKQGQQRIGIEASNAATNRGRLDVEKQRFGFESGGGVSPQAHMIFEGKIDPVTTRAMIRSNPGLLGQVKQLGPFDEAKVENRYNTLKEFTSTSNTKAGGQILALNTLIHHADLYQKTAEALKNGSFVPGNAVYNAVAQAFGSAPPTNANLVARFFAGETGKVATGGVPAEGEINGMLRNMSTSGSPEAMKGAGDTLLGIAAGRLIPLKERADQADISNIVQILGPDAKSILQARGFDPNTLKAGQAGSGATIPARLSASDVGKVFKSQKTGKNIKITAVNPNDPTQFRSEPAQ